MMHEMCVFLLMITQRKLDNLMNRKFTQPITPSSQSTLCAYNTEYYNKWNLETQREHFLLFCVFDVYIKHTVYLNDRKMCN